MKSFYNNIFYDANGNAKVRALSSPLFYVGIIIKLLLGTFLASSFLTEYFAPFINLSVNTGDAYVNSVGNGIEFPYPGFMHIVFYLPHKLLDLLGLSTNTTSILNLFIFRLTCLFFDFGILLVMLRWLRNHQKKVLLFYWLSPILIYITYIHGQLDVVPISLLIISFYFLFKDKYLPFAFFLALGICAKTSIALAVPFVLIYRYKYQKPILVQFLKEVIIFAGTILLFNLPFWSPEYFSMVYNNLEQQKLFDASLAFNNNRLFLLIPGLLLVQIILMLKRKWVSKDLLLLFMAFSFGTLTLLISPMQGWYYWIVPFFVYFIIKFNGQSKWLFFLLNVFYLTYFAIIKDSEYLQLLFFSDSTSTLFELLRLNDLHVNVIFTLLQVTLLLFLAELYHKGIKSHINRKLFSQPLLIGLSGDSGSGKTTLTSSIIDIFGSSNTSIIRGDDMHKWERGNKNWKTITHLNPKANDLNQDLEHIKKLKDGYSIYRQKYNHDNGKFTLPFQIKSNRLVVFEGLHSFYLRSQSSLYDLKIYLDPEQEILINRKIKRDVGERGKQEQDVLNQIKEREFDSKQFVQSQKDLADIIIRPILKNGEEKLKVILHAEVALDSMLALISQNTELVVKHEFLEDNKQSIVFHGDVHSNIIELIAAEEFSVLDELGIHNTKWEEGYKGLMQLTVTKCILDKI